MIPLWISPLFLVVSGYGHEALGKLGWVQEGGVGGDFILFTVIFWI